MVVHAVTNIVLIHLSSNVGYEVLLIPVCNNIKYYYSFKIKKRHIETKLYPSSIMKVIMENLPICFRPFNNGDKKINDAA